MVFLARRGVLLRTGVVLGFAALVLAARLWLANAYPALTGTGPLRRAENAGNRVALTFDVTWSDAELLEVLEVLAAEKVHATFFVSHHWAANYPDLLRRLDAAGHEVGTLGFRMADPTALKPEELETELRFAQGLLARTLGRPARLYRPYGGRWNPAVLEAAARSGLQTVVWSVDAGEMTAPPPPPREIARRVTARLQAGDVIRIQASGFATTSAEALPAILRALRDRGLQPGTVSELVTAP
ncbi:polysaccharide deacetylase family protein [Caldinitratiruptor microaerophilus]|uniref:NodB homology domain-containing protein n=1 Tax=Caldinitratiruptor microaerophilus TaxID=671077 RepID=A0AA35G7M2_9FIRM|nr:polysaccharide deacetylase family protein [Caldinitratiruptor microaerophilus]BDG59478.1 hypothetical protein caldi_05680 [Caldinitratiruptor microaerophilus]